MFFLLPSLRPGMQTGSHKVARTLFLFPILANRRRNHFGHLQRGAAHFTFFKSQRPHAQRFDFRVIMDGRGRALDNAYIGRLWRSVKYEDIYLRDYADGPSLHAGLTHCFRIYNSCNHERRHGSPEDQTPACVYRQ